MQRDVRWGSSVARTLAAAALLAGTLGVGLTGGCERQSGGQGCTEIGCFDGLRVDFRHEPWKAGSYEILLDADGTEMHCQTELPLSEKPDVSCSDERVQLGVSGSSLPAEEHALVGIETSPDFHPKKLTMRVLLDGEEIGKETWTPSYERAAPNGEECGPICSYAIVEFEF